MICFVSRIDQIIDLGHEKVNLGGKIDWQFLSDKCGGNYTDKPGHPALLQESISVAVKVSVAKLSDFTKFDC